MSLPWLELFTGIALLIPQTALGASTLATGLLGSFVVALITIGTRGAETIDCGCFGGATLAADLHWAVLWRVLWLGMAGCCTAALWKAAKK